MEAVAVLDDTRHLETLLHNRLPHSLPLLRRMQQGSRTTSTVILATRLPPSHAPREISPTDEPWTAAIVDRTNHPGRQASLFSSIELAVSPSDIPAHVLARVKEQLLQVVAFFDPTDGNGDTLFIGSLNTAVYRTLRSTRFPQHPSQQPPAPVARVSQAYGKYLMETGSLTSTDSNEDDSLPHGLVRTQIQPRDYEAVMAANALVRTPATIAHLPSAALRPGPAAGEVGEAAAAAAAAAAAVAVAVAWAFLDTDGSVRTVHVDPRYRRQGLAKKVVRRLLEGEGARLRQLDRDGRGWASVDIEASNAASVALFRAFGARWMWDAVWVWLDIQKAKELVSLGSE